MIFLSHRVRQTTTVLPTSQSVCAHNSEVYRFLISHLFLSWDRECRRMFSRGGLRSAPHFPRAVPFYTCRTRLTLTPHFSGLAEGSLKKAPGKAAPQQRGLSESQSLEEIFSQVGRMPCSYCVNIVCCVYNGYIFMSRGTL